MARPAGFEPATLGLAYQLRLSTPRLRVCGLDYLFTISGVARIVSTDPFGRQPPGGACDCCHRGVFTLVEPSKHRGRRLPLRDTSKMLFTGGIPVNRRFPRDCHQLGPTGLTVKVSPIQCDPLYGFRFPIKAPGCTLGVRSKADALSK